MLHVLRLFGLSVALLTLPMSAAPGDQPREQPGETSDEKPHRVPGKKPSEAESTYREAIEKLTTSEMSPGLKARLKSIEASFNSPNFTAKLNKHRDIIANLLNTPDAAVGQGTVDNIQAKDRPLLFISASIPADVLRAYAKQLHAAGGGTMVLNGFIGGAKKISPTLEFIAAILNRDADCEGQACEKYAVDIIIDPILFSHHGVTRVPGLTVYERNTYLERCQGENALEVAEVVYGDASLKALALELAKLDHRPSVTRFVDAAGFAP